MHLQIDSTNGPFTYTKDHYYIMIEVCKMYGTESSNDTIVPIPPAAEKTIGEKEP